MSNLLVLDDQSFFLDSNRQGGGAPSRTTMKLRIGGAVVVLFTMPRCRGCNAFKPTFAQLASSHTRLTFATADLAVLKSVVNISRASTTPLQSVPTLILYSDGVPRAKFKGNMNLSSVESFLAKGLTAISTSAASRHPARRTTLSNQPQPSQSMYSGGKSGASSSPDTAPYAALGNPEEEDDTCLLLPNGICPYNQPWTQEFKRI